MQSWQNKSELKQNSQVFVWAVTARCGTGLLQRLITSSKEVLVFGEDEHFVMETPKKLLIGGDLEEEINSSTRQLANGDYSIWCPNALADPEYYRQVSLQNFYNLAFSYRRTALDHDFQRWGTKLPDFNSSVIDVISEALPRSRHIVLYRDLYDVGRSMKGRNMVDNIYEFRDLCQDWAVKLRAALTDASDRENVLIVKYENLVSNQAKVSGRLCDHLDIDSVKQSVFEQKVNTWNREGGTEAGGKYVKPKTLSGQQKEMIRKIPDSLMDMAGYQHE